MATEPLIAWQAPEHYHVEKNLDWYWSVGIITLTLAVITFIFGNIISGILIIVAAVTLVLHASIPPKVVYHEINDRGIMVDQVFYPFLNLDSFWVPHDAYPSKIILKSNKPFSPFIIIQIDEVDPEEIRELLLRYIAESEHRENFLVRLLEVWGF